MMDTAAADIGDRRPRVVIGVPSLDGKLSFNTLSSLDIIRPHLFRRGYDVLLKRTMGSGLSSKRALIAQYAIEMGATHILWLDADTSCKEMAVIDRLFSHDVDIVSATVVSKQPPFMTLAARWEEKEKRWVRFTEFPREPLVEVDGIGFGLMLTKTRVFETILPPLEKYLPRWFGEISRGCTGEIDTNEDYYFCWRAQLAGFKIYLDTNGDDIHHIGEYGYSRNDGENWIAMQKEKRETAERAAGRIVRV